MAESAHKPPEIAWHSLNTKECLERLASNAHGLSTEEAALRLKKYGANTMETSRRIPMWMRFLHQLRDPLVYVLLVALAVATYLEHWVDAGAIAAVILFDALIGFTQEQKAENELSAIRELLSPRANVLRSGELRLINATDLVIGDVVMLSSGDKVPADLRLLSEHALRAQEAILTGESLDVEKSAHASAEKASVSERHSMTYSGTLITAGQGKGVVVATAKETEIGRIGTMLSHVETPDTPLTRKLARFSRWMAAIVLILTLAIFAFGVLERGLTPNEMFMMAVAIAVSAIPEGLPAVISITLAIGVREMARRSAIVRNLPVIEALGSTTVICTDKTGTLTRNELAVTDIATAEHVFEVTGVGYAPEGKILLNQDEIKISEYPAAHALAQAAMLNNDALITAKKGIWELNGDPTEGALMTFALKAGHERDTLRKEWPRADIIPFSAEARTMATLHAGEEHNILYVKGAPESILPLCHKERRGNDDVLLHEDYWKEAVAELARQGKRVLAVACRPMLSSYKKLRSEDTREELTMLGLLGIIDAPREGAEEAIATCLKAGITVKMITGDHALTAASIGKSLGIPNSERVMEGADMALMSDKVLAQAVEKVDIYARMHPEHKLKLVKVLQAKGEVVAMTGDGVNDAPALKTADIGISMGIMGTEVAKESSALVLADDNFATIVYAVKEGRNIYRNIRRTIQFMLVTDACEGLVLILSLLAGFTLPITPLQILWVNMVTSVTLSLSFAFSPYDPDAMKRKPIQLSAPLFQATQIALFAWHVVIIASGTIGLFFYEARTGDIEFARTIAVNALVAFQMYYLWGLLFVQRKNTSGIRPYSPLIISTIAIIILQLFFTYTPWMQEIFATYPIDINSWLEINLVAITIALWIVLERFLFKIDKSS